MNKYIDFTAENAGEECAMLVGRVEAFAAYVAQEKYSITQEMCAAMLGFELPTEVETPREEADA